jgi:hypothetical protein
LVAVVRKGAVVDELELLRAMLTPEIDRPSWYRHYGLTSARRAALTRGPADDNSLLNPASETALTLSVLGALDGWSQIGALTCTPRDDRDNWNGTFFANLRGAASTNYASERGEAKANRSRWAALATLLSGRNTLDLGEAVLLFEFDVSARGFHPPGRRLHNPSFLKLPNTSGWATFDAVLIIPRMKLFLLFEAKLNSDIAIRTTHFPFVNQIVRNLETAYFLTNDPASGYHGWDYRYVFVAPRRSFDRRLTLYSWVVGHIEEQIDVYGRVLDELRCAPDSPVIEDRLVALADFRARSAANLRRATWDELTAVLGPELLSAASYFGSLGAPGLPDEAMKAIRQRLASAGICR